MTRPCLVSELFMPVRGPKPPKPAKETAEEKNSRSATATSDSISNNNALVLSGPERKHHKVYVVELTRKPLFPGIYTPVMITKNEPLIKEIMDTKRQG